MSIPKDSGGPIRRVALVAGVLGIAVVVALILNWDWWMHHAKAIGESWKVWAEFLAYACAAAFFGYRRIWTQ